MTIQKTQDDLLTMDRDIKRGAQVQLPVRMIKEKTPALMPALFGNINLTQHLYSAGNGRSRFTRKILKMGQDPVLSKANPEE